MLFSRQCEQQEQHVVCKTPLAVPKSLFFMDPKWHNGRCVWTVVPPLRNFELLPIFFRTFLCKNTHFGAENACCVEI